ncbi:hypothetical protein M0811_11551 [Anaeramoeba ignava]|uniref:Uncharacterized protein n=1 Tax=Anaeramoeba ignava TaxID=1746090 RepID=A0A9Q0LDP7_ANAIG|nr:hypothetical protein M0811_11551 [Anaeramoeba ignava]
MFIVHISSNQEETNTFHFSFEKNFEYYYIDDIFQYDFEMNIDLKTTFPGNYLEKVIEENWEKIFELIIPISILKFLNSKKKIEKTKKFFEEMKLSKNKEILMKKIREMIQKGKNGNIKLYEWNINELINEKFEKKRRNESLTSFIQFKFKEKLETIFAILFSNIMINDNFKLFPINQKDTNEIQKLWEKIFKNLKIPHFQNILTYQFNNSNFPFFQYFYSKLFEETKQQEENKIIQEIIEKPIIKWSNQYSKNPKTTAQIFLKAFMSDFTKISFTKEEQKFLEEYIGNISDFIYQFEKMKI